MKTFTCFVPGTLRDEAVESIAKFSKDTHFRILTEEPTHYGRAVADEWDQCEGFIMVEPDIVIREDVIDAANNCGCEYGCFPYAWKTDIGPALGCTWFKKSFIEKFPTAPHEAKHVSWKQFDVVFMRHVLARKYGQQPHVHLPPVEHLNEEKQLLPEADPTPLMEVPLW